ncbi:MAG TPA: response regulator [Elusimicrobiales bacterium]|nr:response regulator [Elusimicrobiales bacterium]
MPKKILIVDDEEKIRFLLQKALEGQYDVLTAPEGLSAVELVKKERPDLVFLDFNMPGPDGVAVLKLIKETGQCPVVWMLTGVDDLGTVLKALETGAAGYITKPLEIEKIRSIAADALNSPGTGGQPGARPWQVKKTE